ncbi:MAG: hypothetical protein HRU20_27290, partial [Pseudomonadales bacterium]|nr:hypothetical protein [Pseudomonadales bacterium]
SKTEQETKSARISLNAGSWAEAAKGAMTTSGGLNASKRTTDAENVSTSWTNSLIQAGTINSSSDSLTVKGANIVANDITIETNTLVVESLQNTEQGSSQTRGQSIGIGFGGEGISSASGGMEKSDSENSRAWVDQQTTLLGANTISITAKDTTITGAVIANASEDENGQLIDHGNLALQTETLAVNDIYDTDESDTQGFSINSSISTNNFRDIDQTGGSTTVSAHKNGYIREQTTKASMGMGYIVVAGKAANDEDLAGLNRDLNNSQEITKDMETGGLNATLTIDHKLLTAEGRQEIAKSAVTAYLHGDEIIEAVTDVATTDKSATEFFSGVRNYAATRETLAANAVNAQQQKALRGEGGAQGSEDASQALSNALSKSQGIDEADIALYDGSQIQDNSVALDKSAVNKTEVEGAYHGDGKGIYVNIDKTDMTNSTDVVKTLVHEQERHRQSQAGELGSLSRDSQTVLAANQADQAAQVWTMFSALGGQSTTSTVSQADWNKANYQAENVTAGTTQIKAVDNNDLKARQLNLREASILDNARDKIRSNPVLSNTSKEKQLHKLDAQACAAVECAAGVPETDDNYARLAALQVEGEALNDDIYATLDELGVDYKASEASGEDDSFEYGFKDGLGDVVDQNDEMVTQAAGVAQAAGGVAGVVGGVSLTIGGAVSCVPSSGVGCGVAVVGSGITALSASEVSDGLDKVLGEYESTHGQRVADSFSAETHQGEYDAFDGFVQGMAIGAAEMVTAKIGGKYVDDIIEKNGDSKAAKALEQQQVANKQQEINGTKDAEFDTPDRDVIAQSEPEAITDPARLLEHRSNPDGLINDERVSVVVDQKSLEKYFVQKDVDGNPLRNSEGEYVLSDKATIPKGKYVGFQKDLDGLTDAETKHKLTIESIPGHKGYEQYEDDIFRIDFDLPDPDSKLSIPGKSDYLNDIGGPVTLGGVRQRIPNESIPLKGANPKVTPLSADVSRTDKTTMPPAARGADTTSLTVPNNKGIGDVTDPSFIGPVFDKGERLKIINQRLADAPAASNADDAMSLLHRSFDDVEDAFSSVPKVENPGLKYQGRMYAPRADYTTTMPDGSLEAITKGNIVKISPQGDIDFFLKNKDGTTGKNVFSKKGASQ